MFGCIQAMFGHVFNCTLYTCFFPNSHAMGSCKTNRRTGAVGSPSELVGGWCPGHVLMASGSCDAGVPVMFSWCPGHVLMVSRSCCDGVPVMFSRCPGHVVMVSRSCCDGVPGMF